MGVEMQYIEKPQTPRVKQKKIVESYTVKIKNADFLLLVYEIERSLSLCLSLQKETEKI